MARIRFVVCFVGIAVKRLGLVGIIALSACVTPPLVRSGGVRAIELDSRLRVDLAMELVELEVEPDVRLRGIYVAAGECAPLAVTFLGSAGSVSCPQRDGGYVFDVAILAREFKQHGVASLIVDYRGVGASDGARTPRNIAVDAWAIWKEALRRAGGRADRIELRGLSIGTLAVASLLERGVQPGCVTLHAPVRAETVASNWVSFHYSRPLAWLADLFLARPVDVDLIGALARAPASTLVLTGTEDEFLPPSERERVRAVVERRGGSWCEGPGDHLETVNSGYSLLAPEAQLLSGRYPDRALTAHVWGCGVTFDDLGRWRAVAGDE